MPLDGSVGSVFMCLAKSLLMHPAIQLPSSTGLTADFFSGQQCKGVGAQPLQICRP